MVDRVLFNHWRDAKFTCCMIGEMCKRLLGDNQVV